MAANQKNRKNSRGFSNEDACRTPWLMRGGNEDVYDKSTVIRGPLQRGPLAVQISGSMHIRRLVRADPRRGRRRRASCHPGADRDGIVTRADGLIGRSLQARRDRERPIHPATAPMDGRQQRRRRHNSRCSTGRRSRGTSSDRRGTARMALPPCSTAARPGPCNCDHARRRASLVRPARRGEPARRRSAGHPSMAPPPTRCREVRRRCNRWRRTDTTGPSSDREMDGDQWKIPARAGAGDQDRRRALWGIGHRHAQAVDHRCHQRRPRSREKMAGFSATSGAQYAVAPLDRANGSADVLPVHQIVRPEYGECPAVPLNRLGRCQRRNSASCRSTNGSAK